MDISFKTECGRFNYRVCALILRDGKLLAMRDERTPYFYLPGGRVSMQETAEDALLREVKEELGIHARIERLLFINQSFFCEDVSGERYHELCFYFLADTSGTDLAERGERFRHYEREHTQDYEWIPFDRLKDAYIYPLFIKEWIHRLPMTPILLTERQ